MNESSDYFKKSYVEITYHSKPKIIRLTDEGFVFIKKFNQYVSLYDCYEWQVYLFFYSDFLTKYNSSIRKACLPPGIIFENCIKSRKFAMEVDPKNESVNRFVTAAQKIRDDLLEKKGGDAVEVKAINSWIEKRNMCDFIEVF
jgi:hypothetical protein